MAKCHKRKRIVRFSNRAFVDTLKENTPCMDCLTYYPAPVMEFDHVGGHTKTDTISRMVGNELSIRTILIEIQKCELVCANCHRLRTIQRKKNHSSR